MMVERIADVVVDEPSRLLDQIFSYRIPVPLVEKVKQGSRVCVPFGKQIHHGFVYELRSLSTVPDSYRFLEAVLDPLPLLTPELLKIADYMATRYFCTLGHALATMVPVAVRGTIGRRLRQGDVDADRFLSSLAAQPIFTHWRQKGKRSSSVKELLSLSGVDADLLRSLIEEGLLVYEDHQKGGQASKVLWVEWQPPKKLAEGLAHLSVRAVRQRMVLQYGMDHPGRIRLRDLLGITGISRSAVRRLVELGYLKIMEGGTLLEWGGGNHDGIQEQPMPLVPGQARAWESLCSIIRRDVYAPVLLQGVTGSGKTELYLRAISEVLSRGKGALVLVPEIALAPQTVARLQSRFGDNVVVWHSGLVDSDRYAVWQRIRQGKVDIVVGARSAVFAPLYRLGIIVIDEEHESTYAQDGNPAYHAVAIAHQRARYHGCVLLLGSATPSLPTYCLARRNYYQHLVLSERVCKRPLPPVSIVDMRRETLDGSRHMFSQSLYQALESCYRSGEQAMLFLNRRGFSSCLLCRHCGEAIRCEHCDVTLTYHKQVHQLLCHYCDYHIPPVTHCPNCDSDRLYPMGMGTQRVEMALQQLFPTLRVLRMDVDTTQKRGAHERMLASFAAGEADLLLGTQMIAKGLDFTRLTLVGVVVADTLLHWPHYRAAERTFQLLVQVSGRAGRHNPGRVIIQTYHPEHYSIALAAQQNSDIFYQRELQMRRAHHYPPFCMLGTVLMSHPDREIVWQRANVWVERCRRELSEVASEIWGPVVAPIPRLADRHRMQIVMKLPIDPTAYRRVLSSLRTWVLEEQKREKMRIRVTLEGADVMVAKGV
ncbi:primosomal protein N' [Pasteuria penetrans]|uniref:primosomal protein N' n=1 Tax=Pasteuria penetrans TaxID=86005 RepID=UPI0011ECE2CF|nr:primosomal protein N' [Pasteuria penetrans]